MMKIPDNKVHVAIMGPIWGRQDPGGSHVGPMSFAIWENMVFRRLIFMMGNPMHGETVFTLKRDLVHGTTVLTLKRDLVR